MYFRFFVIIYPWKRAGPSFYQTWVLIIKEYFVTILVEIGQEVLEKKIFKFRQCIFAFFCNYLPWEKGGALHLNKLKSLHPRILCAKFGWKSPSGSGEEDENVKSLRRQRRRRTTDKFWSEKLTWAFGSGELKTRKYNTKPSKFLYHF